MRSTNQSINWSELRAAAIALQSVNEAAKRASIDLPRDEAERFRERVNKRAYRERWLEKANQLATTKPITNSKPLSKQVQSGSQLLTTRLQEDNRETKLSLSKGVRRLAKHIETLPEPILFAGAANVKQAVSSASQIHSWDQQEEGGGTMSGLRVYSKQTVLNVQVKD